MQKLIRLLSIIFSLLPIYSLAHPHAFIEMRTKPIIEEQKLTGFSMQWILDEASSAAVLYDLAFVKDNEKELQKFIDDMIQNVVNEHYFSYFFDKKGDKIKYSAQPKNYGLKSNGAQVLYYFDFFLTKPQNLSNNKFELSTYDPTYYVSMYYDKDNKEESAVDFSKLPQHCKGNIVEPQVDQKLQEYAASLDRNQRGEDSSLGVIFAQKVVIQCQ
ncbi:ABC transporter [Canicola haemoglobinophilus]|uniref:ABC-type transport system, periplasmic component n=1 Tax=Canicola haemoglobinophilus TaxID=733 RepID=A0A1V4B1S0_9PAST|nr:DUF1007 family protein [Canicola haemoglobinophilus]OOS01099.1 ABC transporter [Canicola haemoglobinophilus]STO60339.1 ABC-type transport system, periplasmic component [Canicola haemoglobinophilus]